MKLKKKPKIILTTLLILILLGVCAYFGYKMFYKEEKKVKEVKVLKEIDSYGYKLKDNKSQKYKSLFDELVKILEEDEVDEDKYVSKVAEMFIYDFYSLEDKTAKTDVGGVDFVLPAVLENFLLNAEDTYYKYVESNIYGNRNQELPIVKEITIDDVQQTSYSIKDGATDPKAYKVKVSWNYEKEGYESYQDGATLVFMHNDKRLDLVELE